MKKVIYLFISILLILSMGGCSTGNMPLQPSIAAIPSQITSPSPTPTQTASPSVSAMPSPSPSVFVADTNIPDIMRDPQEAMANTNYTFYADEDNIYYYDYYYLYCVNKATNSKKKIVGKYKEGDILGFTVYNGSVYLAMTYQDGSILDIEKYNVKAKKYEVLYTADQDFDNFEGLYNIVYYKNKLYFTNNEGIASIDLDGSNKQKVFSGDVNNFCIYKDKFYYEENKKNSPLYVYDINNGKNEKLDVPPNDYYFEIGYEKIFPYSSNIEYDINSGENKSFIPKGYKELALTGQYVFYTNNEQTYIYAYDITTGKRYSIFDNTNIKTKNIYPSTYNIYFECETDNYIYELSIENGKAVIEKMAEIPDEQ